MGTACTSIFKYKTQTCIFLKPHYSLVYPGKLKPKKTKDEGHKASFIDLKVELVLTININLIYQK